MNTVIDQASLVLAWSAWLVVALRLPSARRHQTKRLLWAAFAALAVALTLASPQIATWADVIGAAWPARAVMYLGGIMACAALLEWVIALTWDGTDTKARRGFRYGVASGTGAVVTVLLASAGDRHRATATMAAQATAVFCAVALAAASIMLLTAAGRSPRGLLRRALSILGAATTLGTVSFTACLVSLSVSLTGRMTDWSAHGGATALPAIAEGIGTVAIGLLLAGSSLTTASNALAAWRDYLALNRLRPLWLLLTAPCPDLILGTPATRRTDLTTLTGLRERLIRRTVEIRDASTLLRGYVAVPDLEWAHARLAERGLHGSRLYAAATAVAVRAALLAQAGGDGPGPYEPTAPYGGADLAAEVQWLLLVAHADRSPHITELAHELNRRAARTQPVE